MAHSPVVIAAYEGITHAVGRLGTCDARTKETIELAAGNEDGHDYCQSAHSICAHHLARRAGLSQAFVRIAANLFTNYVNHYAGTQLDIAPAPAIPEPKSRTTTVRATAPIRISMP